MKTSRSNFLCGFMGAGKSTLIEEIDSKEALVSVAMKEQNLTELLNLASGGFDGATRLSRTDCKTIVRRR